MSFIMGTTVAKCKHWWTMALDPRKGLSVQVGTLSSLRGCLKVNTVCHKLSLVLQRLLDHNIKTQQFFCYECLDCGPWNTVKFSRCKKSPREFFRTLNRLMSFIMIYSTWNYLHSPRSFVSNITPTKASFHLINPISIRPIAGRRLA